MVKFNRKKNRVELSVEEWNKIVKLLEQLEQQNVAKATKKKIEQLSTKIRKINPRKRNSVVSVFKKLHYAILHEHKAKTSNYNSAIQQLIQFLNKHYKESDIVAVNVHYIYNPLKAEITYKGFEVYQLKVVSSKWLKIK